jgi:hypothetical protein
MESKEDTSLAGNLRSNRRIKIPPRAIIRDIVRIKNKEKGLN